MRMQRHCVAWISCLYGRNCICKANSTPDYTLGNPDTLTKYKTAGQISEKVLAEVAKLCVAGAKIVDICDKGDKLLEDELSKVYRGKKITKGQSGQWVCFPSIYPFRRSKSD